MSNAIEGDYGHCAVVTNTTQTSIVGRNILAKGGSAVDAIIATLLCEGLTCMQNMGLGGGVFMTIYERDTGKAFFMDAREAAPLRATTHMFRGNSAMASSGGLAIALPGELMGYWEAHRRFGRLPWRDLFQPAITMCRTGIPINARLAKSFAHSGMEGEIMDSPTLRQVLAPLGRLPKAGELMTNPALARTLMTVADDWGGAMALYNGSLTDAFLRDLESVGSLLTRRDLANYKVNWHDPITTHLEGGHTLYTAPPPASGSILSFVMRSLEGQLENRPRPSTSNTLKIVEAFKYAYALRTELGDPLYTDTSHVLYKARDQNYVNEVASKIFHLKKTHYSPEYYGAHYHSRSRGGTINIVVQAPNGDAVVATSTINTLLIIHLVDPTSTHWFHSVNINIIMECKDRFGSLQASPSTGIILNNEMDDFSSPDIVNSFGVPPSQANFIEGGKRPLSSATPTIIVGPTGDVKMAIGSAGGTQIISAVAQVVMNHMWFSMGIKQAVDMPRVHHQLLPMVVKYEDGIPRSVVDGLVKAGHKVQMMGPHSSVTAVANVHGRVTAAYDYRRGGSTAGF